MTDNVSNLRDTIVPKSDQLNSEQLMSAPITITLTAVNRGNDEQPVTLHYDGEDGRPYKPCKSMRKVLIFAWGDDGGEWIGKSMTLYNDPSVKFGGIKVGGIRISHLSHIERDIAIMLTATRGKKQEFVIKKLAEVRAKPEPSPPHQPPSENAAPAFLTPEQVAEIEEALGFTGIGMATFLSSAKLQSIYEMPVGRLPGALIWIKAQADKAAAQKAEGPL